MASAGAALSARTETSILIGGWLFVISDALAFVALLATMLALGGAQGGAGALAWAATASLLGMSLALVLVKGRLALVLAAVAIAGFVLLNGYALRDFLSHGFGAFDAAGERLLVVLLAHLAHVLVALLLVVRAAMHPGRAIVALPVYLHYLVVLWLVILCLFYL